jgi:hypothetical protein
LRYQIWYRFQNEYMKIKEAVRQMLECNRGYATIMFSLDCSHSAAREYIKHNKDDLTKAAALKAIREFTGLTDEEILEEESNEVVK